MEPTPQPPPEFTKALTLTIPNLRRYARALTHNNDDAEDLVQSALLQALTKYQNFQPGTDLSAWCRTIMHNLHINNMRLITRTYKHKSTLMRLFPIDQEPTQELSVIIKEIGAAIDALVDDHRTILLQAARERTNREMCEELKIPHGTRSSRLWRARGKLRRSLGEQAS